MEASGADGPDRRLARRLRRALVGVSMLAALLALTVAGLLVYWDGWLLSASGDPFTRGPFLTRLGTTDAALRWRLRGDGPPTLSATGPGGSRHRAQGGRFRGLQPGTAYAWTASVGGTVRAAGSFTTAPRRLDRRVTFAVFGDYGVGGDHEWAVGRLAAALDPAFVLTTGDNSYLVGMERLLDHNIFEPLRAVMAEAPLWAALGDHDAAWRGGRDVVRALDLPGGGVRYAVRYGPIQIVVLGVSAAAAAQAFARRALAEPGPALRFVVVHKPLPPGHPLLPLLRRSGVAAVFSGHLHRYERRVVGGVLNLTIGTGGAPRSSSFTPTTEGARVSLAEHGLLRVDAGPGRVVYTFVDTRGRVRDRLVQTTRSGA
ncbi:MAG: tartrate-resistant acid phosphatase type 5 [Miltoncostaeaceae bacterium]|nr:tartrate-resistant acid phosphatase type 5 [Miltoncostaeaceae bacterium]